MATAPVTLPGFDAAADRYDADEAGNPVLIHMRERAFRRLTESFPRGAKLVELGSGTGTEAARLAREHACRVALVDPSRELLGRAVEKVRAVSDEALLGSHPFPARKVIELETIYGASSFDGAYSSFGPLNCEASLEPVARGLGRLVRPGGALVLSIINRWCPAEVAWYALHGELREATRRWRGPVMAAAYPGGPKDVRTFYYSRRETASVFSPWFRVEHASALPLLWPPPYLDFLVTRFRRAFEILELFEDAAADKPVLRDLGDHVLLTLRRV